MTTLSKELTTTSTKTTVKEGGKFDTSNIDTFRYQLLAMKAGSIVEVTMEKGGIPAVFSYLNRSVQRGRGGTTFYHFRSTTGQELAINWKKDLPFSMKLVRRGTQEAVVENPVAIRKERDGVVLRVDNDGLKDFINMSIVGPLTATVELQTKTYAMVEAIYNKMFKGTKKQQKQLRSSSTEVLRELSTNNRTKIESYANLAAE